MVVESVGMRCWDQIIMGGDERDVHCGSDQPWQEVTNFFGYEYHYHH